MRTSFTTVIFIILTALFLFPAPLSAGWTVDGAPVCTVAGVQDEVCIASDGLGGAFIAWVDRRSYPDIYAQRLNERGIRQWDEGGVIVCGAGYNQGTPQIIEDGSGGAFIVWYDHRDNTPNDIYAQRVDRDGNMLWTADGVPVCTADEVQSMPMLCSDGAGGCIIAWTDERASVLTDIYVQRLDADGIAQWTENGVSICDAMGIQGEIQLVEDGSGGAIITWLDYRDGGDIYAQKLNPAGAVQWTEDGIAVNNDVGIQYNPQIDTDGAGGAMIAWYDSNFDVYVQRISAGGTKLFAASGVLLCTAPETRRDPEIVASGTGSAIIVWKDWRSLDHYDLYAQRVSASGSILWGSGGAPVCVGIDGCYDQAITSDTEKGAIIAWRDTRNILTTGNEIFIDRIDSTGTSLWSVNGLGICTAAGSQSNPAIITDCSCGAVVAWEDDRNPDTDIYAQRIIASGDIISTMLSSFDARCGQTGIFIEWTLSSIDEGTSFIISRTSGGSPPVMLSDTRAERDGLRFSFFDGGVDAGIPYVYTIEALYEGRKTFLFRTDELTITPFAWALHQNVPNPFNPATAIRYSLKEAADVRLDIFDASGRLVRKLSGGFQEPGEKTVLWDGTGDSGRPLPSGVYFCRIDTRIYKHAIKMVLLR